MIERFRIPLMLFLLLFSTKVMSQGKFKKKLDFSNELISEPIIFSYNKFDILVLDGQQIIAKDTKLISGNIELYPNHVKVIFNDQFEIFKILDTHKEQDGYQLKGINDVQEDVIFMIIKRQGMNFVSLHLIEENVISLFHITGGFKLNLEFYD